jgi:hypothetical protein
MNCHRPLRPGHRLTLTSFDGIEIVVGLWGFDIELRKPQPAILLIWVG